MASVWRSLIEQRGVQIDFAHTTFVWGSEANDAAHVHCVIVGFSCIGVEKKIIYTDGNGIRAGNISPYLVDAPTVYIDRRANPLCAVPPIYRGSQPTDDGNLLLTEQEKDELLELDPPAVGFIRPFMMGKDFINRKYRYCLWLDGADPSILKKCPHVLERIDKVRTFRLTSKKAATRKKAETPMLFDENHACDTDYVAIPKVSSQRRRYIPMELLSSDVIAGDKLFMMPEATLYAFGVLESNVHMAWTRVVCGRLKSDYSYSNTIVYNNFPWPAPTEEQKQKIEQTAHAILDARALYPDSSLADLYDPLTMPSELQKAHSANDVAVMKAYGMPIKGTTESDCVAWLMRLYQELVQESQERE